MLNFLIFGAAQQNITMEFVAPKNSIQRQRQQGKVTSEMAQAMAPWEVRGFITA